MTWPVPPAVPISPMIDEDDVLRSRPRPDRERRRPSTLHVLGLFLDQSLGGEHVLHLRCPDSMGQCAKSPVGGCVAVTTDYGRAGQGEALFRADDVDNALPDIVLHQSNSIPNSLQRSDAKRFDLHAWIPDRQ